MNTTEQIQLARSKSFLQELAGRYGAIRLTGGDAGKFLHDLSTADVERLEPGMHCPNALLDKRSAIIALFHTFRLDDAYILTSEAAPMGRMREYLEKMHFTEDLSIEGEGSLALFALQGPEAPARLTELAGGTAFTGEPAERAVRLAVDGTDLLVLPYSLTGDPGYFLAVERSAGGNRDAAAIGRLGKDAFRIGAEAADVLRLEAGIPLHGIDYDETTLLLELARSGERIGTHKGCYPGQEIVSRIQSRGRVKKRLVGLLLEPYDDVPPGSAIREGGEEIGTITSSCFSPATGRGIAWAELKKPHYDSIGMERQLELGGRSVTACPVHTPFYLSPELVARYEREYDRGMDAYHADNYERAITHFRKACDLTPGNPDPFEALGMAFERSGDVDGAIRANQHFAELHPTAFMAHTNLSRLYMLKGLKEEAERAMGTSTMIQMRLNARSAEEKAELEKKRREADRAARESRLAIFRQVLDMDAEDELANFGLGSYYCDGGEYDRAIEHLSIVVRNNPDYSAAFALLGEALVESGRHEEANDILRRGIAAAERQGDRMPLKKMQEKLKHVV